LVVKLAHKLLGLQGQSLANALERQLAPRLAGRQDHLLEHNVEKRLPRKYLRKRLLHFESFLLRNLRRLVLRLEPKLDVKRLLKLFKK